MGGRGRGVVLIWGGCCIGMSCFEAVYNACLHQARRAPVRLNSQDAESTPSPLRSCYSSVCLDSYIASISSAVTRSVSSISSK